MGLDMYLYKVSTPEINEGEIINDIHEDPRCSGVKFINTDAENVLCDTIKKIAVKCIITERYYNMRKIITDYLMNFDVLEEKASEYAEKFYQGGSSYSCTKQSFSLYCDDNEEVKRILNSIGNSDETILETTPSMTTSIRYEKDYDRIVVSFTVNETNMHYEGKYLITKNNKKYAVIMKEVDYQRKGLNDTGWSLLPENCCYCDDKDLICEMTEDGGLSESFIENWIDDETVFWAWW